MKRTYIQPQATSICLFTEDTLLNNSVVLSDETTIQMPINGARNAMTMVAFGSI